MTDAGEHRDEVGDGPGALLGFEPEGPHPSTARRRIVGKSAPRVAALEGQCEVYDDDLVSDREEMSDLEDYAVELDVNDGVMIPRIAVLEASTSSGGEAVRNDQGEAP